MNSEEHQFLRNFSVNRISKSYYNPRSHYDSFNTYGNQSRNYYGYGIEEKMLEVEITMRGWDELMSYYKMTEKLSALETHEHQMREKHPAIKEMYEKYQMLLQLYR